VVSFLGLLEDFNKKCQNANWNNPTTTSNYLNYSTEVKDRDEDLAIMFDGSTATNIPANTVRWNSTNSKFEKWDGTSAWGDLDTLYDISVTNLNGKTASSFLQLTGGGSQTITSGSLTISENSGAPLGLKGGTSDFVYLTLYADAAAQSSASSYYGFTSLGNQTLRVQNLYTNSNIDLITNGSGQVLSNGNQILDEGGGHSVTGTLSLGALVTFSSVNGVIFTNVGEGLEIKNGSTAGNPTLGGHSPNDIRLINLYDLNGPSDGALLIKSDLLTSGDAATELVYLDSSNFEWKGNQVVTEGGGQTINGSLTVGSFTSTGINDITTGKRLTVANGEVIFGTAGVDFLINQSTNDRFLGISGGNATSSGANILLYGGTHANTGDLYLRNDGNSFFIWDESTGSMQFYTGTGVKSSVLTLNSSQTAVFSGNITTQGNSVIHTGGGQTIAGTLTATTFSGNATTATTASTVTTAAQPSITSLGSLTGLTLNGSLTLNNHIISELNLATLDFRSGHSTISAIRFLSSTGSSLGYVYGEGNDIGFLNGTGSWQLRLK